MRMTILGGLVVATATAAVSSPEAPPVQTPGSVALLLLQPFDATTSERWAAALEDSRPEVRAAAARAINARGAATLAENVRRALASETDLEAADEEILAAGALGGPAEVEAILDAAKRFRGVAASHAAEILARMYGVEALRHLPALHAAGLAAFEPMFRLATKDGTESLTSVSAAVLAQNDDAQWDALLRCAREGGGSMDPSIMTEALGSSSEAIRATTYWHLALSKAGKGPTPAAPDRSVEAALKAEPPKDLAGAVARELLARATGRKAVEQPAWLAALEAKAFPIGRIEELAGAPPVLDLLTPAEMKAVSVARYGGPETLSVLSKRARSQPRAAKNDPPRQAVVRTVDRFPPGFVAGILEAAGCDPRSGHGIAIAEITYGTDGRPRQVGMFGPPAGQQSLGGPAPCQRAAAVLLASSLAPAGHRTKPETKEMVLVLLDPAPISCLAEKEPLVLPQRVSSEAEGGEPGPAFGKIRGPKKITHVNPRYPPAAEQARIQGVVVVEAILSPTGCVRSLELVHGIGALNWEALHAVAQWRYTPTLLNGVPVPVIMTVTVNFRLGG
jgi:TonB family protein